MTDSELKSIKNCIWLCRKHARLIDLERGKKFSASDLYGFRDRHESRVSRELGDLPAMDGWLTSVSLTKSPLFADEHVITFGKSTVFIGPNGTGKTALLEWLTAAFTFEWPERWRDTDVELSVQFEDSRRAHELRCVVRDGVVAGSLDEEVIPFFPVAFRFLLVRSEEWGTGGRLERIGRQLGLTPSQVIQVMRAVPEDANSLISAVDFDGDEFRVRLRSWPEDHPSVASLSEAELQLLVVECAIAQARLLARHSPVVLLLDAGFTVFDRQVMSDFMMRVSGANLPFQSVVVLCSEQPGLEGWQVYEFAKRDGVLTIERRNVE